MKTNIKMRVNPEQSKIVQEICFENGILNYGYSKLLQEYDRIIIASKDIAIGLYDGNLLEYYDRFDCEEIDADLFIRTNGSCEEKYPLYYEAEYQSQGHIGFVKSALDKVVKEQCQKLSKEINEAQTFTMCKMENIQLKKKIENLHMALKKKVEKNKLQATEITLLLKQKEDLKEEVNRLLQHEKKLIDDLFKKDMNSFDKNKEIEELNTVIKYLEQKCKLN